jgi:transcriptional regulator of acetoin/glycerol metabolism
MNPLEHMLSPIVFHPDQIVSKILLRMNLPSWTDPHYKISLLTKRDCSAQVDFVRPVIIESWLRSYDYGLNIFDYNYYLFWSKAFCRTAAKKGVFFAGGRSLYPPVGIYSGQYGSIIYLSDEQGVMLRVVVGNSKLVSEQNKRFKIVEGSVWSEKPVGTTGHTLSLVLGIPIQICGPEHYCEKHDQIACSAAPIFDNNNVLAGTLSIVTPSFHHQNPHTLARPLPWPAPSKTNSGTN